MLDYSLRAAYRKLKFLNGEFKDHQGIFSQYENDFNGVVKIARGNIRVQQDRQRLRECLEKAAQQEEKDHELLEEDISVDDIPQKKLYRKIAMESHPDRYDVLDVPSEERKNLHDIFKKASDAYESDNVAEMLRLALELDIDIKDLGLDDNVLLDYMDRAIKRIEFDIKSMEETFVWLWGTSLGNLEARVRLLDAYLRQTGHPPVVNTILRDIIRHHEDPNAPKDGSRGRSKRKMGERPKKLIR